MYKQLSESVKLPDAYFSKIELGTIATISSGCTNLLHDWPQEQLQPCMIIEKVIENTLILQGPKFVRITERERRKFLFRSGDIIFKNRTNPREFGKSTLFNLNEEVLHTRYLRIRPMEGIDGEMLNQALNLLRYRQQFKEFSTHTSKLSFISIEDLKRLPVPGIRL
ncbi:hypothetical protein [Dyadobacter sp. 3J3]|uniref:hypothetical protein n=1 Tax=Dyadobacter sp. 3J3 TaxID=2606600 RepID=UPI001357F842|nr:hypothetical protein [Dyadobacter sp. 3J3]